MLNYVEILSTLLIELVIATADHGFKCSKIEGYLLRTAISNQMVEMSEVLVCVVGYLLSALEVSLKHVVQNASFGSPQHLVRYCEVLVLNEIHIQLGIACPLVPRAALLVKRG